MLFEPRVAFTLEHPLPVCVGNGLIRFSFCEDSQHRFGFVSD
jgi:hypothetical protein